jgi:hypothetical protein
MGEFHSDKNRAKQLSFAGIFIAFALIFCPGFFIQFSFNPLEIQLKLSRSRLASDDIERQQSDLRFLLTSSISLASVAILFASLLDSESRFVCSSFNPSRIAKVSSQ